jgi:hypothetical protein
MIDPNQLEHVGENRANPLDPRQVGAVHQAQERSLVNPAALGELPPLLGRARFA